MQLYLQMSFKNNLKDYDRLKANSYLIKDFNRGTMDFRAFQENMKILYKERVTDKINNVVDNMDFLNSVLNILK